MLDRESMELGQVVGDLPGMVYMRVHTTVYHGARGYVHAHGVGLRNRCVTPSFLLRV